MSEPRVAGELQEVRRNWFWFLILGILLTVLGLIGLSFSVIFTVAALFMFGVLLLIAGAGQIVHAFYARRWSGFVLLLVLGILSVILGVFIVGHPLWAAVELTLFLAIMLIVSGTFRIGSAVARRYPHWGLEVLGGFISILLGVVLTAGWPLSGVWFPGFCVAIDLLMQGFSWIFFAFAVRQVA